MLLNSSTKFPKYKEPLSDTFMDCESPSSKILPIPIIYRKIQNDKKMRQRLAVFGYKHFSKLSACGEDTPLTLEKISKPHNMRYIRKFEFDPYLCEKSHMKALCKALKKFKDLSDVNLVIRRLDYVNESDRLQHVLPRLFRLDKVRLEMTRIENMDDDGMINFGKTFGKLYSMKECEQIMVGMDHISQYASIHWKKYGNKLILCKKFKKRLNKAILCKFDPVMREKEDEFMRKIKPCKHLTEMIIRFTMPQGWLSMSTDVDESSASHFKMIALQKKLERLHISFCGNPVPLETIQALGEAVPDLACLKTLSIEFLNSRLSENEIVVFAQLLLELKPLENLTFKVIQYPNVSEGSICYLMSVISKLTNLKQFNIYFRRLDTTSDMVQEFLKRIRSYDNIHCSVSKQSLAFTRAEED